MRSRANWEAVLKRAAAAGREAILKNYDRASRQEVVKRGAGGDLTLKIDDASERAIHSSLKKDLGDESFVFLSEELGEVGVMDGSSYPVIICDPLDGSHNAQAGIPFFSLALSVIEPGMPRTFGNISVALITSIKTNDEYFAMKGRGAFHNGARLSVGGKVGDRITTLLVETGDVDFLRDSLIKKMRSKLVYKIRILGSAALSYCLLADGTAEGFIFAQPDGARTIDSPAGYLIAKEAGCVFADVSRKHKNIDDVEVGFASRIDLVGARDTKTLAIMKNLVRFS